MTYEYDFHESKEAGRAEGRAEGIAVGKAEGIAVGKAEGRAEATAEALAEKKAMAKGLRDDGVPLEIISKRTGFSVEEIAAL